VQMKLQERGFQEHQISTTLFLNLRFQGTDTAIMVSGPPRGGVPEVLLGGTQRQRVQRRVKAAGAQAHPEQKVPRVQAHLGRGCQQRWGWGRGRTGGFRFDSGFKASFRREYGFLLRGRPILVDDVRVKGWGPPPCCSPPPSPAPPPPPPTPEPLTPPHRVYFRETGWAPTPVFLLEKLRAPECIPGPAVILNGVSTVVVEPQWVALVTEHGNLRLDMGAPGGPFECAPWERYRASGGSSSGAGTDSRAGRWVWHSHRG